MWPQSNESPNCCPRPVQCPSGMEACPPGQLINMADGVWHCQRIRKDLCALYGNPSQRPYNTTPTRSPLIPTTSLPPLSHALHGYPTKGKPLTQGPHRSRLRRPSTSQGTKSAWRGARDPPHVGATSRHMRNWMGVARKRGVGVCPKVSPQSNVRACPEDGPPLGPPP